MMKKFFLILLFFVSSCGYQSIYLNKTLTDYEFKMVSFEGDNNINKEILNILSIKEGEQFNSKLFVKSSYQIKEISKNSKGQVTLYKDIIMIDLNIKNINNEKIKGKNFTREFTYNNKDNKFDLVKFQNSVKDDLISATINDIIIFLNSE